MRRTILRFVSLLVLITSVVPVVASAAVFERDWKTPGDRLLTYDDVNRREWLDLSVSLLNQFPSPWLENGLAEIGPGGLFDGFTLARASDVRAFARSAGIDVTTIDYATNEAATRNVMDLLGLTLNHLPHLHSLGFIDPVGFAVPTPPTAGADFRISFNPATGQGAIAGLTISSASDYFTPWEYYPAIVGLMLYRNVPEPATLVFALISSLALSAISRFRRPCRS